MSSRNSNRIGSKLTPLSYLSAGGRLDEEGDGGGRGARSNELGSADIIIVSSCCSLRDPSVSWILCIGMCSKLYVYFTLYI